MEGQLTFEPQDGGLILEDGLSRITQLRDLLMVQEEAPVLRCFPLPRRQQLSQHHLQANEEGEQCFYKGFSELSRIFQPF